MRLTEKQWTFLRMLQKRGAAGIPGSAAFLNLRTFESLARRGFAVHIISGTKGRYQVTAEGKALKPPARKRRVRKV